MISDHSYDKIRKMANNDSLMLLGNIWYGEDAETTVANIYTFGNKGINVVRGIRMESAIAMSTSGKVTDSVQIELNIHYSRFKSHLQKLFALIQITPVLPVMNPTIASILMPIELNLLQYVAYGLVDPQFLEKRDTVIYSRERLMEIYSSIPVQCSIDNIRISSIREVSRDLSIVIGLSRVTTANSYGDVVKYVKTFNDAAKQEKLIRKAFNMGGDCVQTDTLSTLFGSNIKSVRDMIDSLKLEDSIVATNKETTEYIIKEIIDGSRYSIIPNTDTAIARGKSVIRKIRGIAVPPTSNTLKLAPLTGKKYSTLNPDKIAKYQEYADRSKNVANLLLTGNSNKRNMLTESMSIIVNVKTLGNSKEIPTEKTASFILSDEAKTDIGYQLILSGFAIVVPDEFTTEETDIKASYIKAQATAKKKKNGLWGDSPSFMNDFSTGNLWKNIQSGKRKNKVAAPEWKLQRGL